MEAKCAEDVGQVGQGCGPKGAKYVGQNVPGGVGGCRPKCAEDVVRNVPRM